MKNRIETVFGVLKAWCGLVTSLPRLISEYLEYYIGTIFTYRALN